VHEETLQSAEVDRNAPVGFTPDEKPNWGISASPTSLRVIGVDDTITAKTPRTMKLENRFIKSSGDKTKGQAKW